MPGFSESPVETSDARIAQIQVSAIIANPRQPRARFNAEALRELAESIREVGVLQPLIVRAIGAGRYELIAGERRLRASKMAGLVKVPAIIRQAGSQKSLEIALIENIQREDISPLECAYAYHRLTAEFGLTQQQVARKVGKSRVAITNTLRLMHLPPRILEGLQSNRISEGHARALLGFGSPAQQLAAFDLVLAKGLSVRETEEIARRSQTRSARKDPLADVSVQALEEALSMRLGAPVELAKSGKGGRLEISFFDDDDLERIVEVLGIRL
ncbi:MAG: ParB/RepB/Spo0J family partition protein [Fimbriimonadaceae bacterium]